MKDRIKQLMEAQHMNQQTFATYTGIGTASLSSIFNGRTRPTLNHVDAIIEKFPNVNPLWLLKGIGGMMLSADDNLNAPMQGSANLTAEASLFNNPAARIITNNNTINSNTKSPSGFHFEVEQ